MNLDFRERLKQRRIKSSVSLQANAAAETVFKLHYEGVKPPFRFNATNAPKGMSPEEYADRVGAHTVELLIGKMPETEIPIGYDPDASHMATNEFDSITPEARHQPQQDEVIVVFAGKTALS